MDSRAPRGENQGVLGAGVSRRQIARTLNAAYAGGLRSEDTFVKRLDQRFAARLVELIGKTIGL